MYQRFNSLLGIVPIVLAVLMYKGSGHGVWFYLDWKSDSSSDSSFGSGEDSGSDGGGD